MNEINAVKYIRSSSALPDKQTPEHTRHLLRVLDEPHSKIKFLKIYGEAGRSLLASRLSRMLAESGLSVGTISLTRPQNASRESILFGSTAISGIAFAEAVERIASILQLPNDELAGHSPTAEELLLCAGLVVLREMGCQFIILELADAPHTAASVIDAPLLSIVTATESEAVAMRICSLLDKNSGETVSALQPPHTTKRLIDRLAALNGRLTFPIKQNFYIMEHTLGKIRFFYDKKEFNLNSGAEYELYASLTLIEVYRALVRRGVRVMEQALFYTLLAPSSEIHFRVLSVDPIMISDAADTPARLACLRKTLLFQRPILGNVLEIWTNARVADDITAALTDDGAMTFHMLLKLDEKNIYRAVKNALRERDRSVPLLVLGDAEFVRHVYRTIQGFL